MSIFQKRQNSYPSITTENYNHKQAGTGPSRRHIQGSKIAKRLPSVKYSFTVLENQNFLKKKFSKKLLKKWTKNLTMPKKTERGDPLGFFNIHSVAKHQKNAGGTLWGKILFFEKKVSQCRKKNERGESLVSPGMVWYAEKQEKPFWFSSLDQIVHFDAIIFCRTFKNYFGQFVWIEKKKKKRKVTIIVAFHFMKRRLKSNKI